MGIKNNHLIAILLFLGIAEFSVAQVSDTALIERNGRKYYIHIVEPGNTLYSISKSRNVAVKQIELDNPNAKNGLSIGDTLYILAVDKDKKAIEMKMEIDGNIIVHEVQKGQTLYGIAKMYDLKVSDLIEVNPSIKDGIEPGQLIKIPIVKLKKNVEEAPPIETDGLKRHVVDSGETLYGISKLYSAEIEELKNANGGLTEGLKVGMTLIIPMAGGGPVEESEFKDRYNVAMILPFFLDLNDTLIAHMTIDDKEQVVPKSLIALQFYEGALMALDSLKKLGYKFHIDVYDSSKDTAFAQNLIISGALDTADIIIGPFYRSQFFEISKYAKAQKIHIVSPVPLKNSILLGNEYVSKVATSQNVVYNRLADHIFKYYKSENVIVITQHFRANANAYAFKTRYEELLKAENDTNLRPPIEVKWDKGEVDAIKAQLMDSVFNFILIPSKDQAYVTDLLAKLNVLREDYLFKVIGRENWLKYNNIDLEYFENLNVMIPVDGFVDYQSDTTRDFVQTYHERFETFPERYSFIGYDVTFYYLHLLSKYGTRFEVNMTEEKLKLMHYSFDFFKTGIESGYENTSMRLLEYQEFEIKEVNR